MVKQTGLFQPAKSKRLANLVDLTSPNAFRMGLMRAKKGGFSLSEKRAFVLGQNRAKAQLQRKNLSPKERKQFMVISRVRLPKVTKR